MTPKLPRINLETCQFPKHRGKLWTEVVEEDRPYVEWIVSGEGPQVHDTLYDHLIELLETS